MFPNDPDLKAFEELLQGFALQEADVYLAMKTKGLTAEAGADMLVEINKHKLEAKQGSIYQRWLEAGKALRKPESE